MKAYSIIWNNPTYYSDHIVMVGSFHLVSAYLKIIGKKMHGYGFTDTFIESGLMSIGSMDGVVFGKKKLCSISSLSQSDGRGIRETASRDVL